MRTQSGASILGASIVFASMLAVLCATSDESGASTPRAAPLTLTQVGDRLYLQQGKARLLLEGSEERAVSRVGGWKLLLTPETRGGDQSVRVFRRGRPLARVSLDRLRDEWLKRDALWGPGKAGNDVRYIHQSAGGIGGFLGEAFPTSAGWVGILNWRFFGPSGEPVGARHLVRIPAGARPTIEPVRRLRGERSQPYTEPRPRLFASAGKLLLWEPGELTEIGPKGERLRRFMQLPGGAEPHSLLGNRWLVRACQDDGGTSARIDAVDLHRKSARLLLEEPRVDRGYRHTWIRDADAATQTLLLQTSSDREDARNLSLLSVPSGTRRFVRTPWVERVRRLWRGYLITHEEGGYTAYDAQTLKLVKHLPSKTAR